MRCEAYQPSHGAEHYSGYRCSQDAGHTGQHQDEHGNKWSILSHQPDRAAQVEEIYRLNALDAQLSDAGFTREELAATAAKQARPAPTKDEILAAILDVDEGKHGDFREARGLAYDAVEKLFEERDL